MNKNEIDQLARAVARELGLTDPARGVSAREVADTSWRMPIGGRAKATEISNKLDVSDSMVSTGGPVRVADFVDHTVLKAETTRSQIETLCQEAAEHKFAAVCVNGSWVPLCADLLKGSGVKVATVVGFPLGAMRTFAKAAETRDLVEQGADEVDMVIALGQILDDNWDYVEDDIRAVVEAAGGRTVKVILESGALEPLQVVKASAISKVAGAHFVKTSTGFHSSGGATPEAVSLMRLAVGDSLGVKASGGVRDCASALRMIAAGANRLGTSSGVKLIECIGSGPVMLKELLSDPDSHERVCLTGNCPSSY
jgi:deoxyribose-phosphate aldolase